jgi:hypothetical protein
MPLPSLFISGDGTRAWRTGRAAVYGAGIGAAAAFLKTLGPLREPHLAFFMTLAEITGAAVGFALLCAGAAALRNVIARRLIWPDLS